VGSRSVTLPILCSAVFGGELAASRPDRFTSGKETRYPLNKGLSALQSRSGRFCRRETPPEEARVGTERIVNKVVRTHQHNTNSAVLKTARCLKKEVQKETRKMKVSITEKTK